MRHYIIWIEGLDAKSGEKVKALTDTGFSYTNKMMKAMRIREFEIPYMKDYMKRHGIAQWCIDSHNTFIRTSYVPKGTLYKFNLAK